MNEELKRVGRRIIPIVRITLGIISILVGLAGLVLPILQGWLFLIIGVLLLSKDIPFFRRLMDLLEKRFPWIGRTRVHSRKRLKAIKLWLKTLLPKRD